MHHKTIANNIGLKMETTGTGKYIFEVGINYSTEFMLWPWKKVGYLRIRVKSDQRVISENEYRNSTDKTKLTNKLIFPYGP